MSWSLLLALLQAPLPTVGDTIWLERVVDVPAGAAVRAADWNPTGLVELLGRPTVDRSSTTALVRYPATAWSPGSHTVEVPGPIILHADGRTDSLAPKSFRFDVGTVLPAAGTESSLVIQPAVGILPDVHPTPLPLLAFWAVAGVLLVPIGLWWRRRGAPSPALPPPGPAPDPPIERWAEAGESRAIAAQAAARLRAAVAEQLPEAAVALETEACLAAVRAARPQWPLMVLSQILADLDTARFAPSGEADIPELHRRALQLAAALRPPAVDS